jgi:hypothetical protein
MILIICCTSKQFYALNGIGVYISEIIPITKWFSLEMWGTKKTKIGGTSHLGGA